MSYGQCFDTVSVSLRFCTKLSVYWLLRLNAFCVNVAIIVVMRTFECGAINRTALDTDIGKRNTNACLSMTYARAPWRRPSEHSDIQ